MSFKNRGSNCHSNRLFSALFSLVLLLFALGGCTQQPDVPKPELSVATLLPEPQPLPDVSLHGMTGNLNPETLQGQWSLLFFGYTHCPDVCPTELFKLGEIAKTMQEEGFSAELPQVYFISVDAQRDTPESLNQFVTYFHDSFQGVVGEQQEIDRLASALGVIYERVYMRNGKELMLKKGETPPEELSNSYLINHSASSYLINPRGKLQAVFPILTTTAFVVDDLVDIQHYYATLQQ